MTVTGDASFEVGDTARRLRGLATALTDLRPFWPVARGIVVDWLRRNYESRGAFSGEPWAALSPTYARWKASVRPGKPLLVFDGTLKRATLAPDPQYRPHEMVLTIRAPHAIYHQRGTRRMPARPPVPRRIPAAAQAELTRAVDDYVEAEIKRWGF